MHTTRNSEGIKQFMVRVLFVTSGDPDPAAGRLLRGIDRRPTSDEGLLPPAKKAKK